MTNFGICIINLRHWTAWQQYHCRDFCQLFMSLHICFDVSHVAREQWYAIMEETKNLEFTEI